jgi:hypothetical protein
MTPNRLMVTWVLGLAAAGMFGACGTDAEGVSECRDIEYVRCEAGAYCSEFRNVSACRRFTRDHCLHGLSVGDVPASQTQACVEALRRAGDCAREQGPTTDPDACASNIESNADTICDVVLRPELAEACAFIVPEDERDRDEEVRSVEEEPRDAG